jgi:hypothetical protein
MADTYVHRLNTSNLCIAALGVPHAVSRSPAEPRPSRSSAGSLGGRGAANPMIGKAAAASSLIGNAAAASSLIGNAASASSLIGNAAADGSMISGCSAPDRVAAAANSLVYCAAVISLVGRQTDVLGAETASTKRSLIIRYFKIC